MVVLQVEDDALHILANKQLLLQVCAQTPPRTRCRVGKLRMLLMIAVFCPGAPVDPQELAQAANGRRHDVLLDLGFLAQAVGDRAPLEDLVALVVTFAGLDQLRHGNDPGNGGEVPLNGFCQGLLGVLLGSSHRGFLLPSV